MTVLHSTEPATVYLSLQARVDGLTVADVDRALYTDRSLVKQLAMRRTVFVFPRELVSAALGSASKRVLAQYGPPLLRNVVASGLAGDGEAWLTEIRDAVRTVLADGAELSAIELRERVPALAGRIVIAPDKAYGGEFPVAGRALAHLGAEGVVTRGRNGGHWRTSRPQWTLLERWLGEEPEAVSESQGYAQLTERWLATFGPGTDSDLAWWLGSTRAAARAALADVGAEQIVLDGGGVGWVRQGDTEPTEPVEPWAALLPVLDPTVMGWKERTFYLGPHAADVFDRNGNAGTTAWWDGRIVGAWAQAPDGVVHLDLFADAPSAAREALETEADRLTSWLDGTVIATVYPSPAMKRLRERLGTP